jgi:hypothetical protein
MIHCRAASPYPEGKCLILAATKCPANAGQPSWPHVSQYVRSRAGTRLAGRRPAPVR